MAEASASKCVVTVDDPSEIQLLLMTGETKEELQKIWSDLEFMDDEEVLKKFRCQQCQQIVLSHCTGANCKHIFCQECFNEISQKPCPVANCSNESIDQGERDLHLEVSLCKLKVKCIWQKFGCQEISSLRHFLDHQMKCPVFTQKLDPSMWQRDQLPDDAVQLKNSILHLEQKIEKLEENSLRKNLLAELKVDLSKHFDDEISKKLAQQKLAMEKGLQFNLSEELEAQLSELEKRLTKKITEEAENTKIQLENQNQRYLKEQSDLYQVEFPTTATAQINSKVEQVKSILTDDVMRCLSEDTKKYAENLKNHISSEFSTNLEQCKNQLTISMEKEFKDKFQLFSAEFQTSAAEQLLTECNSQYRELLTTLNGHLKDTSECLMRELLMKLTQDLTRKLDNDVKQSEASLNNSMMTELTRNENDCKMKLDKVLEDKTREFNSLKECVQRITTFF